LIFTVLWGVLAIVAVGLEIGTAIFSPNNTLSNKVWEWITGVGNPKFPRWLAIVNRAVIGGFLVWLIPHFLFGWFSP
jgi:hypothetical protein